MNTQTRSITIRLNGQSRQVPADCTLHALLKNLEMSGQRVAIEVNENVVPRSEYSTAVLNEGDRVEIIRAIGGG